MLQPPLTLDEEGVGVSDLPAQVLRGRLVLAVLAVQTMQGLPLHNRGGGGGGHGLFTLYTKNEAEHQLEHSYTGNNSYAAS